jgi:hypothetical protein
VRAPANVIAVMDWTAPDQGGMQAVEVRGIKRVTLQCLLAQVKQVATDWDRNIGFLRLIQNNGGLNRGKQMKRRLREVGRS